MAKTADRAFSIVVKDFYVRNNVSGENIWNISN